MLYPIELSKHVDGNSKRGIRVTPVSLKLVAEVFNQKYRGDKPYGAFALVVTQGLEPWIVRL